MREYRVGGEGGQVQAVRETLNDQREEGPHDDNIVNSLFTPTN